MTENKERASSAQDWNEYYDSRSKESVFQSIDINDFRNFPHKTLIDQIKGLINRNDANSSVIEIGAGDSNLLIDISQRFNPGEVYGLDYLEQGCERLSKKSEQAKVDIEIVCADLFMPPTDLIRKFDFVMSYGVVEHFHDLPGTLKAIGEFCSDNGQIMTLIPNNKGTIYGFLMRHWNIDVYNAHVMYGKEDLELAHKKADLEIISCNYLVSSHFGMLSWCFKERESGLNYWIYKQLTRVSKLIWFMESKIGPLKPLRFFSPYIICISRPKK